LRIAPAPESDLYGFRSTLVRGDRAATTLQPQVQLKIGDDEGTVTLDLARARFGKGKFGGDWVFGDQ